MRYYRVYIELTNICGLRCSFCPTKNLPTQTMSLELFDKTLSQVSKYTNEIACHVMGDPLTLSNLSDYFDIVQKYSLKAVVTTSGYFISNHSFESLLHPSVKQINISLNSFNKNDTSMSFNEFINPILELCRFKNSYSKDKFINLRVWNIDELMSEKDFNQIIFSKLSSYFKIDLDLKKIYKDKPKSIRLDYKVLLHFDNYFEWPSLNNKVYGDGTCQGLSSHIAILSSGVVVPCCLDGDGVMELGNLQENLLDDILHSQRANLIRDGFNQKKAVEDLCKKCSYKDRFN